jgi:hypothetical protein
MQERLSMLKISVEENRDSRRLIVEGRLTAPWVAELRELCERAKTDLDGRELLVELRDLLVISQEGQNVLAELIAKGVTVRSSSGVFTRHILDELAHRHHPKSEGMAR